MVTKITQYFGKETCIKQVKNSMFDPANVLIYPQPVVCILFINTCGFPFFGIGRITELVPARLYKGIECIRFTNGIDSTDGAGTVFPSRMIFQRIPLTCNFYIFRECDRKVLYFFRHKSTGITMHKRNGRTPVTLAADPPVSQLIVCCPFTCTFFFKEVDDRHFCFSTVCT